MLLRKLLLSGRAAAIIPSVAKPRDEAAASIIKNSNNFFIFCFKITNSSKNSSIFNSLRSFSVVALHASDLVSTSPPLSNKEDLRFKGEHSVTDCDNKEDGCPASSSSSSQKIETLEDLSYCLEQQGVPTSLASTIVDSIPPCKRCQVNFQQLFSLVCFLQTMDMEVDKIPVLMKAAPFMYQQNPGLHLEPKIRYLETLGIQRKDMCRLILKYPYSLYRPLEVIQEQVRYLQSLSLDDQDLHKVIKKSPLAFRLDAKKHLKPRLEFLKTMGVFPADIKKAVLNGSRILSMTPEKLQKNGSFLQELGFQVGTENFSRVILRCGPVTCKTLQAGLETLSEVGFTQEEVELLVARLPLVLSRNKKDTCSKIKYLVEVMNRTPNQVLYCPVFLMLSLDKRIRPRHEALLQWKKTKKVDKEYSLSYVFLPSDKVLATRFPGIKLKGRSKVDS